MTKVKYVMDKPDGCENCPLAVHESIFMRCIPLKDRICWANKMIDKRCPLVEDISDINDKKIMMDIIEKLSDEYDNYIDKFYKR